MSKKRVAKVFKPWPLFLLFRFAAPANWKNRFAPASVLDHCKFEESLRSEQLADLVAAEQQVYSATGRAVVDMGEMPAFHLYRAQEVMKKIVERISEDCYHKPILPFAQAYLHRGA